MILMKKIMPLIYAKIIQRKMVNTNNKHKRVVDQYLANTEGYLITNFFLNLSIFYFYFDLAKLHACS